MQNNQRKRFLSPGKLGITPGWPWQAATGPVRGKKVAGKVACVVFVLETPHLVCNLRTGIVYNKVPQGKETVAKMRLSHLLIKTFPRAGELNHFCLCHRKAAKSGSRQRQPGKNRENNADFGQNRNSSFLGSAGRSGVRSLGGKKAEKGEKAEKSMKRGGKGKKE